MQNDSERLRVEGLYKVFGPSPDDALRRAREGAAKSDIHRETGSVVAVSDVGFAVRPGEIFVVMGLSGSGKSTLIRCINRLIEPTRGSIHIDGEDMLAADASRLREIRLTKLAMVFQHFALFPHMSVGGNVEYGLKIRGVEAEERTERAAKALDLVGLAGWDDSMPEELSGGMQQRVGLARALAVDPEILLMDEPFSALDPLIRREMQDELAEIQRRLDVTIVFITHDLHEALRLGDHIAIMKDGEFVQVSTPEGIVSEPADDYVREFVQDVDRSRVFTFGSLMHPAEAAVREEDAVDDALRRLDHEPGLHVVDDDGRPVGFVRAEDLRAAKKGKETCGSLMERDIPAVAEDDKLVAGFRACRRGLPLAVLDADGRLCGVVDPLEVLGTLDTSDLATDDDAPHAERTGPAQETPPRAASAEGG